MAKTERLYIRIEEELKNKLQKLANKEHRTLSNYVESILIKQIKTEDIMNLKERIELAINKEAMRTGKMGTESVTIRLQLTDTEIEDFKNIDFDEHYYWEIEDNELCISYTEEI